MASYTYDHLELGEEHSLGCKCCRLRNGDDLPIPKKLSLTEISTLAKKFSHSIFADWTKLNAILKRFEATIQKRWLKKSQKQKQEILLRAWPEISSTHRPDFVGFRNGGHRNTPRSRTCPSVAYLWPYINLEDLEQHRLLLLFLNSRGRHLPDMFVKADFDASHLGKGWQVPEDESKPSSERVSMQFQGLHSPRSYGRLLPNSVAHRVKTIEPYVPICGLLVLEIQQGLYSFLLSCAKLILHDIDPKQYFLAPHQPEPTLPAPSTVEWPSLTAHMLEAPYRVPQKLDLDRLKTLAGARRAAAEDHLWMLREDPVYFVDTFREWKEHSKLMLLHYCLDCWQKVGAEVLCDAFANFTSWDYIYRKLDSMPSIETQMQRADWRNMRLYANDEVTWAALLDIMSDMIYVSLTHLSTGFPPSPRMRHCYRFGDFLRKNTSIWELVKRFSTSECRVHTLFYALTHCDERELHGLSRLVEEIQYMLDMEPTASELVDSWITGHFSDLAMLSELQRHIVGLEPWSAIWMNAGVYESKAVEMSTRMLDDLNRPLLEALPQAFIDARLHGDPLDGTFEYPTAKSYTKATTDKIRCAEKALDKFWSQIESSVKKTSGLSVNDIIRNRLLEPRELQRTPEWIAPLIPLKKLATLAEISNNVPVFRDVSSTVLAETPIKPKTKIKTTGVPSSATDAARRATDVSCQPSTAADSNLIKIPLAKRTYKVFAALLPESSAANHQRTEIAWTDFLQAMNTIGLQPEKLYGSVWIFKPKANGQSLVHVNRSIQFHEPKEVRRGNKIPPNMVRTFGRRLKRAYGWEDGMFVSE